MRHQKTRHKLSRDASHRKALLANLCIEVIDHERIKTTEAKAKAVKPEIEKLITLAKKGDLHARRQAISTLQHPDKGIIYKLFEEIAPRYTERPGLKALIAASRLHGPPDCGHLGFLHGPRINAGGRIGAQQSDGDLWMAKTDFVQQRSAVAVGEAILRQAKIDVTGALEHLKGGLGA